MTTTAARLSVFDAALPTVPYHGVRCPDEAHEIIAAARLQAPIAMGPFGPELLTYLGRLALRDSRSRCRRPTAWRCKASRQARSGTRWPR
jgi:hypothetical protein